jgi:multidrug efflux pump
MHFTEIFIRRPVFSTVLSLIILLIGLRSFLSLPLREYPNIESSVISISTFYPGANANLMEGFITTPLENSLSGINGIDFTSSYSTQNMSNIIIKFKLGHDLNKAITDVSNAISSARSRLPRNIDDPTISKHDPNAQPTVFIAYGSHSLTKEALTDYLQRIVQPQLETLPGVSKAEIYGQRSYAMRIWLDPNRMAAHNITPSDITAAFTNNNVQAAPGLLDSPWQETTINAKTDLTTANQFNNLVIRNQNGYLTHVSDVGHAELGPSNNTVAVNMNGNTNSVVMAVIPQATANPLDVSKEVSRILLQLKSNIPSGTESKVVWDTSKFIAQSLKEVRSTIFESVLFVVVVIFLFLGSLRQVTIPLLTIPFSIIGVCGFMLMMGYTLNTLTLLAWVLAIGLVVDDAIVVVENIHRHIENGESPLSAAIKGAKEIGFPVIAMTLTLAAVYAPIGFMAGLTGRLFREFAFTLASAVTISGFIALTLSPMMCSKFLSQHIQKKGFIAKIDELFHSFAKKYQQILEKILQNRKPVLILMLVIYGLCYLLYITLHHELAPTEDQGGLYAVISAPTAANIDYTEKYSQEIAKIFNQVPEKASYGIIDGYPSVNSGFAFLALKPWDERSRSSTEIIAALTPQFWMIPGIKAFPFNLPPLPGTSGGSAVKIAIKTTESYQKLNQVTQKFINTVTKENPAILNLSSDLKLDKPQIDMTIHRNKANSLGVSMEDISTALNTLLGQPVSGQFEMQGRGYDVIPQLYPEFRNYAEQLENINVRTTSGDLIPLSNLVTLKEISAPQSLNHFQEMRSAMLTGGLAPGYSLGEALNYLNHLAQKQFPSHFAIDYAGQSRQFIEANGAMEKTLFFAIIFIFLVLAAQFESFRDPFIVMVSVPLSLTGALIAMHLTGTTLNIYTQIGLVTLIGLISKHGILIVEFANQLQRKGNTLSSAVIEAAVLRLRPILMTTGAMLFGALPLALASGAGAEARKQLGYVILGGMSFGTLFTLFIVPVVYTFLAAQKAEDEKYKTKILTSQEMN